MNLTKLLKPKSVAVIGASEAEYTLYIRKEKVYLEFPAIRVFPIYRIPLI